MADEAVKTQLELIADALNKINDTKNDIANAVSGHVDKDNKQIEIPETAPLFEYADYISKIKVGNNIETNSLYATENGSYPAENGTVWNPIDVEVEVEVGSTEITSNGTYDAASEGLIGWDSIHIDVTEDDDDDYEDPDTGKEDKDLILGQAEFPSNGIRYASNTVAEDGSPFYLDGWDEVTVNVPEEAQKQEDVEYVVEFFKNAGDKEPVGIDRVKHGGEAVYNGPVLIREGLYFTGWKPIPTNVKEDMKVYAQFSKSEPYENEIQDPWSTIVSSDRTKYKPGSYKALDLGEYGIVRMQKVNSGGAWIAMDPLAKKLSFSKYKYTTYTANSDGSHTPNPSIENGGKPYDDSYNPNGWRTSGLRAKLNSDVYNAIPEVVRNKIVTKTLASRTYEFLMSDFNGNVDFYFTNERSQDKIWIPSFKEVFGDSKDYKEDGTHYTLFNSVENRKLAKDNSYIPYLLRSCYSSNIGCVNVSGKFASANNTDEQFIRIGFVI